MANGVPSNPVPRYDRDFLLSPGKRQDPARGTGAQPDFLHDAGNVGGSLDTLERRGHGRKP